MLDTIALEIIDNGYNELRRAEMLCETPDDNTLLEARNCLMYAGIEYFDAIAYVGPNQQVNELRLAIDMMNDHIGRLEYMSYHVPIEDIEF